MFIVHKISFCGKWAIKLLNTHFYHGAVNSHFNDMKSVIQTPTIFSETNETRESFYLDLKACKHYVNDILEIYSRKPDFEL